MSDDNRAHAALRDFIAELNAAWEAAGPPSYSRLEKLSISFGSSEQAGGLRLRVLAASTTHEILRGKRRSLPEWGWVVAFVNVLRFASVENGLDPDVVGTIADWKTRHQQARMIMRAGPEGGPDPDPDPEPDHDHDPDPDTDPGHRGPPADRAPPRPQRGSSSSNFRVSRGSTYGSSSAGRPAAMARPRSSSALSSAPRRIARLLIHNHTRKMMIPARLP